MRSRIRRFLGKPGSQGWQITCSQCHAASKAIKSNKASSMPPDIVIKKLTREGWEVGDKPKQDLCPECISKAHKSAIKSHAPLAKKAIADLQSPLVEVEDRRFHFNELMVAVDHVTPQQAKELIVRLRSRIPPPTPRKPKIQPVLMSDSEYARWLDEQETKQQPTESL